MRRSIVTVLALFTVAASLSAHVLVSPSKSEAGEVQRYELRIHNQEDAAATSFDLEIPEGVEVVEVPNPKAGSVTTTKTGNRITSISWTLEVLTNKYVAFPFIAKNPANRTEVHWNVREHFADKSVIDWSDRPGAQEKGSITALVPR